MLTTEECPEMNVGTGKFSDENFSRWTWVSQCLLKQSKGWCRWWWQLDYWSYKSCKMATLPQGNQELLVVRDKVGRHPGELGISKSMECDIFPSVLWHCWLGDRKGIRPVKRLVVGLLVVMIWLELCTTYSSSSPVVTTTSIILCFNKHRLTQVHLENGR